jgi:uncharacterized membrane protein
MAKRQIMRGAQSGLDWTGDGRPNGMKKLNEEKIARGLGWFSIGLGLAEIVAPRSLAKLIGVRGDHSSLLRTLGMREIASGVGILTERRPSGALAAWLWSRVGGDAIDLALLGTAFNLKKSNRGRLVAATAAVAGVTALDVICSQRLSRRNGASSGVPVHVRQSVSINHSPEVLYRFWRDFQNLPRFMKHIESIRQTTDGRLQWVAKAPVGMAVEWDAEVTEDRPNELIAWRSIEGAGVDSVGSVRFERAPGGRGSIVRAEIRYSPSAGVVGAAVAKLFGKGLEWQIKEDLRRFKQIMEAGEIITTEGQPAGRASGVSWRYDCDARI